MKYCTYCGKEIMDEAVICVGCGCPTGKKSVPAADKTALLTTLAQRLNTNGIIWLVIGILQIVGGLLISWWMMVVGVLNIISAVRDMNYSKTLQENSAGIVARFEPIAGAIIVLIYTLVIGGIVGVAGSIYYLVAVRNYVMENRQHFDALAQ